jgi:hypothetical protein
MNKHRNFYINGKLEFSFFCDEKEKDQKKIMDAFFKDKDYKSMASYCDWKISKYEFSEDLMRVDITLVNKRKQKN